MDELRGWTVTCTEHAPGEWSVTGTATDDSGDHMGSTVVGDEAAAVAYAATQFPGATPKVHRLRHRHR